MKKNVMEKDLNTFKQLEKFLQENPDYRGSFISVIEEIKKVWTREKKATTLVHFYRERLNKLEQRRLLKFLVLFQNLLISQNEEGKAILESANNTEEAIFNQLFRAGSFQNKLLRGKI